MVHISARVIILPAPRLAYARDRIAKSRERGRRLIVTESVRRKKGDIAPVTKILALAERCGAGVIVGEAHATGVQGPAGRGIAARDVAQHLAAVVHTGGKHARTQGRLFAGQPCRRSILSITLGH